MCPRIIKIALPIKTLQTKQKTVGFVSFLDILANSFSLLIRRDELPKDLTVLHEK